MLPEITLARSNHIPGGTAPIIVFPMYQKPWSP
jgi:hypothetical protein